MDKQLVNRLVREIGLGNKNAFGLLYRGLKDPLFLFIDKQGLTFEDKEDIIQDVFYQVVKNAPKLVKYENCFGWIFTIAKNTMVNVFRKRNAAEKYRNSEKVFLTATQFNSGNVEKAGVIIDIKDAMKLLPEDTQTAIILYHVYDFTYEMIGEMYHMSIDRIRRVIMKGIEKLKEILKSTQKNDGQIDYLLEEVRSDG